MNEKKWIRNLIWITLTCFVSFFLIRGYFRITDDFRLAHMVYEFPHDKAWDTEPLTQSEKKELDTLFSQPFTYIGKGAQSYAFESADHKYVIKFFKFKHLKPSWIVEHLPEVGPLTNYKQENIRRKERLINSVFNGYKLANDVHKAETGIIYLHLNPTNIWNKQLTLIDKIGMKWSVDLDHIVYLIQEKCETSRASLACALDQNDLATAKNRFDEIIDLYLSEYSKGIYDRDHGVLHNTGFVGDRVIHLDVGKLTKDDTMKDLAVYKPDLIKVANKFEIWLRRNYPDAYIELIRHIETRLSLIFGEPFTF